MIFLASLISSLIVAVLIARAIRQRGLLPALKPARSIAEDRRIAVIVPARNEAANIGACLEGLLAQSYRRYSILVIDDNSSDETAAIAARYAGGRLALLRAPPLDPGWTGKCHACWLGARRVAKDVEWLCFLDADMRCEPALLHNALVAALESGADLVSLAPRHILVSFAERLMIPTGLFFLAFYQDLRQRLAEDGEATANGQFMLVRRQAYEEVGGHAAVRSAICEDLMLARLIKRSGGRVLMMDGSACIATRMYAGWTSLWEGFSKNLSQMLGGPARTLLCAAAAFVVAWYLVLTPIAGAVLLQTRLDGAGLVLALMALAAFTGLHMAGARHFRIPLWYGFLFPLGYSIGAGMALDSLRRRWSGQVRWKGRVYP